MKKHPVDDIFKGKLNDLERRPSAAAWERIREGQKRREPRRVVWVWFAAAGVIVAFMAGYLVWVNQSADVKEQWTKATPVIVKPDSMRPQPLIEPEAELAQEAPQNFVPPSKNRGSAVETHRIVKVKPVQDEVSTTTVAFEEPVQLQLVPPSIEPIIPSIEIPQMAVVETSQPKYESRTIVVKVEESSDMSEEKGKSSRLGKIFRQLKNVKQGESVDWEDVGFNPKALVARVDDKLRNGEEKVSEKYQNLKEKTKL